MREIKAPNRISDDAIDQAPTVFLAGSIEMGTAENWQDHVVRELADTDVTIFNPRRDDWDSSWEQSIHNKKFHEQVTWELEHLEKADLIVMYFAPGTKSPITLLELGLFAEGSAMIVCCPEGFWRKGNVDIVCDYCGVMQVDTLDDIIQHIRTRQDL